MPLIPLVKPFVGERFTDTDSLSQLLSPPYDVISDALREELASRHDRNIVRLILPDGNTDRYDNARTLTAEWRADGTLKGEDEPGVYVVQQTFTTPMGDECTRTGLLGALAAEPYAGGRVRPHEKTHRGPKEDRLALMRSTRTMFEALLMLAPDPDGGLFARLRSVGRTEPLAQASLDGVRIALWFEGGSEGADIAALASRDDIYIADGHHRYETAVAFRNEVPAATHTLALIVPQSDPGLVVLPTHRLLSGTAFRGERLPDVLGNGWNVEARISSTEAGRRAERLEAGCVVVTADGAYVCQERDDVPLARIGINLDDAMQSLNIARVDTMVVEPIQRTVSGALTYSPDPAGIQRAVAEGTSVGVMVPATPVEDVLGVARIGGFMPQKSTYFQPKAPSGLVMLRVADD